MELEIVVAKWITQSTGNSTIEVQTLAQATFDPWVAPSFIDLSAQDQDSFQMSEPDL